MLRRRMRAGAFALALLLLLSRFFFFFLYLLLSLSLHDGPARVVVGCHITPTHLTGSSSSLPFHSSKLGLNVTPLLLSSIHPSYTYPVKSNQSKSFQPQFFSLFFFDLLFQKKLFCRRLFFFFSLNDFRSFLRSIERRHVFFPFMDRKRRIVSYPRSAVTGGGSSCLASQKKRNEIKIFRNQPNGTPGKKK